MLLLRGYSNCCRHMIVACMRLPFFKIFAIVACMNETALFQIIFKFCTFLPKFSKILPFFWRFSEKLHACPYFLEQTKLLFYHRSVSVYHWGITLQMNEKKIKTRIKIRNWADRQYYQIFLLKLTRSRTEWVLSNNTYHQGRWDCMYDKGENCLVG